jgi:hypothetical protein
MKVEYCPSLHLISAIFGKSFVAKIMFIAAIQIHCCSNQARVTGKEEDWHKKVAMSIKMFPINNRDANLRDTP